MDIIIKLIAATAILVISTGLLSFVAYLYYVIENKQLEDKTKRQFHLVKGGYMTTVMSNEQAKKLEDNLKKIMIDAFNGELTSVSINAPATHTTEDLKKMVNQIKKLTKFVTKLEMAHTTRDLIFGEIKTEQSESMCGRFDGIEIWIDPDMATGMIKKVYNDGSSELEYIFKIDATTYGVYKPD